MGCALGARRPAGTGRPGGGERGPSTSRGVDDVEGRLLLGGGGVAPAVDQEEAVVDPRDRCPYTARGKRDSLDRTRILGWIGSEGATPPAVELAFRTIASSDESCRRIGSVGRGRTAVQVSAC